MADKFVVKSVVIQQKFAVISVVVLQKFVCRDKRCIRGTGSVGTRTTDFTGRMIGEVSGETG